MTDLRDDIRLEEFIREEMDARGWNDAEVARRMGVSVEAFRTIAGTSKPLDPLAAGMLASAFGTSAEFWLRLSSAVAKREGVQ